MVRLSVLVFLVLVLAGCTGGEPASTAAANANRGTQTVASSGSADPLGTIEGIVASDERIPIPDATVGLVKLGVEVRTDSAGAFRFIDVPAGAHDLAANKLGYESTAKRVTVVADEVAKADFFLVPTAIVEPFPEVLPHSAQHHVGATQYFTWAVNLTGDGSAVCSGCQWTIRTHASPAFFLIEIDGQHAVPSPSGTQEYFWMFKGHYTGGGGQVGGNPAGSRVITLPGSASYDQETLGSKEKVWWLQILCDTDWVCFEEKRDMWVTLFHDYEEIPDGYTARPPA